MLPSRILDELHASLSVLGVSVQTAWICAALQADMAGGELGALKSIVESAANNNADTAALSAPILAAARESLLARVLFSSLEHIGARRLPACSAEPHSLLRGLHVLQLVECVDVAHSLTELQDQPARSDRSWKMQLTDGTACVAAFERKRCSVLTPQAMQPGVKLALRDVPMRYGILMLEPGHIEVLGGSVPPAAEEVDDDADALAAVEEHLRRQQQQQQQQQAQQNESKQKEREEEKQSIQPQQQQGRPAAASAYPGLQPASAAAASSFSAGRPVAPAAPAGSAAARGPFLPGSSAAASAAALPPQYPRSNVLASSAAPSSAAAAAASSLPLPRSSDEDEFDMIDEEGLAASWEAEEAERAAHQMPPPSAGSPPAEKPLLTAADIMTPEPAAVAAVADASMIDHGGDGDDDGAAPLSQPHSLPPLSQSMPALEMAPSILEMASPVIKPPAAAAAETAPTASSSSAAAAVAASSASMMDVGASAAIPTLTPMSMLLTPPASSSVMADSPAATSASTVVQSPSTMVGTARSAGASPATAPTSATSVEKGSATDSRLPIPVLVAKPEPGGVDGEGSRPASPASSTSSDDCIVLGEGEGPQRSGGHRAAAAAAARSKQIKSEAGAAAAASPSSSSPAADGAAPQSSLRGHLHQSRKGAAAAAAFVPPEVAPATLSRALDACAENKTRLFPPSHALRPFFEALPYTFVHLLPTLAAALPEGTRPQHVLVSAQVQSILHAELSPEYCFRVCVADALSQSTAALSPALVGKIVGCTAAQLQSFPSAAQDMLIDRIESTLQLQLDKPVGPDSVQLMMQLSVQPKSLADDGRTWIQGREPVVLDIRAITPDDRKQLDARKPMITGTKGER